MYRLFLCLTLTCAWAKLYREVLYNEYWRNALKNRFTILLNLWVFCIWTALPFPNYVHLLSVIQMQTQPYNIAILGPTYMDFYQVP